MAIAATKCDLEAERVVQKEEGRALAATIHADFHETSAKDNIEVEEVFKAIAQKLAHRLEEKKSEEKKPKEKKEFRPSVAEESALKMEVRKASDVHKAGDSKQPGKDKKADVHKESDSKEAGKDKIVLTKEQGDPPKRKKCC